MHAYQPHSLNVRTIANMAAACAACVEGGSPSGQRDMYIFGRQQHFYYQQRQQQKQQQKQQQQQQDAGEGEEEGRQGMGASRGGEGEGSAAQEDEEAALLGMERLHGVGLVDPAREAPLQRTAGSGGSAQAPATAAAAAAAGEGEGEGEGGLGAAAAAAAGSPAGSPPAATGAMAHPATEAAHLGTDAAPVPHHQLRPVEQRWLAAAAARVEDSWAYQARRGHTTPGFSPTSAMQLLRAYMQLVGGRVRVRVRVSVCVCACVCMCVLMLMCTEDSWRTQGSHHIGLQQLPRVCAVVLHHTPLAPATGPGQAAAAGGCGGPVGRGRGRVQAWT